MIFHYSSPSRQRQGTEHKISHFLKYLLCWGLNPEQVLYLSLSHIPGLCLAIPQHTIQWNCTHLQWCATITVSHSRTTALTQKENPCPLAHTFCQLLATTLLSLFMDLWIFHRNEIVQYVAFFLLSITFLTFTLAVVRSIRISFISMVK